MRPPIDTEEAARRLARVIVSDIQLYNGAQIAAGQDVSPQIKEGFHHFVGRVAPELHAVFHVVLAERGLAGGKAAQAKAAFTVQPPSPAAGDSRHDSPTPVSMPAVASEGGEVQTTASARRWEEGAGPERATPKVLPIVGSAPTTDDDEEDEGFKDAPTAISAPLSAELQKAAAPTPAPPASVVAGPALSSAPAPVPLETATVSAPAGVFAASEASSPAPDVAGVDPALMATPLPVATQLPPAPAVPAARTPVASVPPRPATHQRRPSAELVTPPPLPSPAMVRQPARFAEPLQIAPNKKPLRPVVDVPTPARVSSDWPSPSSPLDSPAPGGLMSLPETLPTQYPAMGGEIGSVPNLKPGFPWVRLTLAVLIVVATVGALMVMVTR